MILIKKTPFTLPEIEKLREEYEDYVKTVIDLKTGMCSAGGKMHADNEKELLDLGLEQKNLWGGGIDLLVKTVNFNSLINIRPQDDNPSMEILDVERRKKFEELIRYFFEVVISHEK
jgi:hypothetical protein